MDIVCLGEVLIDMFAAEVGKKMTEVSAFIPKPGGAPANVAVAASRLGASSAFIGKVGDDLFGHYLEEVLSKESVNTEGICYDQDARTTMAFIAKPDENTAEFVFYRNPGADTRLYPEELARHILENTKCLHFGSLSLNLEPSRSATNEAVRIARQKGALVSFDVNYRPSLWNSPEEAYQQVMKVVSEVTLLKVNETELELLSGSSEIESAAIALLDLGPELVVITLGPGGSYFQTRDGGKRIKPFSVNTIDATGCGDAFVAGLLCQLVCQEDWRNNLIMYRLEEILQYANAVGALTALNLGVIPALPFADQVEEFLNTFKQ